MALCINGGLHGQIHGGCRQCDDDLIWFTYLCNMILTVYLGRTCCNRLSKISRVGRVCVVQCSIKRTTSFDILYKLNQCRVSQRLNLFVQDQNCVNVDCLSKSLVVKDVKGKKFRSQSICPI